MFELEKSKGHSILWSLVGIYKIRMFLEFETVPTIVIGIVTIAIMIMTIVVDCDNIVLTSPLHMDWG